jgi:hypothetical protein
MRRDRYAPQKASEMNGTARVPSLATARVKAVASDRVDATLDGFTRWAREAPQKLIGDLEADAEELRLLLGLLRDHLGVNDPADMTPGNLRELLLMVYPRKVTLLDVEETADTVPALRDLLAFFADTSAIAPEAAEQLRRELDDIAPRFADAVMDPANWGMARSITQAMASDGVDFDDQEAVQSWIARQNERRDDENPFADDDYDVEDFDLDDEDFSLKEALGLPDRLPPVRLPPEPELAAMSRAAPLLGQARMLAEWVAPGRDVTEEGELTAEDTVAAARELGIPLPVKGDAAAQPVPAAATGMQDVPELARLWDIAFDAGFLELDFDGERIEPGEELDTWPDGEDEEVLEVWSMALPSLVNRLEDDADLDDSLGELLDFTDDGWALMVLLFLARDRGVPVREASDVIREAATDELEPAEAEEAWQAWTQEHGDPAEYLLSMLSEFGAVSLSDQPSGESAELEKVARLTPLGTWAMRELLLEDDVDIALLRPADQMTAADLLAVAEDLDEDEFQAETAAWLELRTPEAAASELLTAAADVDPAERLLAVGTVQKLGAAAEAAWRESLGRPELRPYAKISLTEIAGGEPGVTVLPGLEPEAADIGWMLTDTLAATAADPEDLPQQISAAIPAGQEQQAFDAISMSPHPDAASLLTLIGRHHPDKQIAKAARKSAHRAASRPKPAG